MLQKPLLGEFWYQWLHYDIKVLKMHQEKYPGKDRK